MFLLYLFIGTSSPVNISYKAKEIFSLSLIIEFCKYLQINFFILTSNKIVFSPIYVLSKKTKAILSLLTFVINKKLNLSIFIIVFKTFFLFVNFSFLFKSLFKFCLLITLLIKSFNDFLFFLLSNTIPGFA